MFNPFSTTGIGSLPHLDPDDACRLVIETFDIPFWPQLPQRSFLEWMIPQYSEGMPFIKVNAQDGQVFINTDTSDELVRFYESCGDNCRIAISEDYAQGLHAFLKLIKSRRLNCIKGQITGPLTFTLGLKDTEERLVFFDEELRQIALMLLQAKARWQIDQLRPHAEKIIIFIDEPILSAIGSSAYLGVSREETLRLLSETVSAVKGAGGIAGIHCCGNAEWPLVIESGVEIISFDAYGYTETLAIYHDAVKRFLDKNGFLAWGIVPTTEAIRSESPESVINRFEDSLMILSRYIPQELLLSQTLITPSCGVGSRTVPEAIKIFQLLLRLKERFA